jgi:hypothetical protein
MSEDEGFQIKDRRRLDLEGDLKEEYVEKPKTKPEQIQPEIKPSPSNELDFLSFLMNLSAMAYDALGLEPTSKGINPEDAKYIIDVIGILEEKTKGNLTLQEERTLQGILYELRMNYKRLMEDLHPELG